MHTGTFKEYWDSNPDERKRGVEYRQAKDENGKLYPYMISSEGTIRNIYTNKIIIPYTCNEYGHMGVDLFPDRNHMGDLKYGKTEHRISVHRLLMLSFDKITAKKPYINHINFDPTDNNIDNLEACTQQENVKYSYDAGRMKVPDPHSIEFNPKVVRICELLSQGGMRFEDIAKEVGCSTFEVRSIYNRKIRTDISKDYVFKPRNHLAITADDANAVCRLLESHPNISDAEISERTGVLIEFVKGIRERVYRKDISRNRSFIHVPMDSIPLASGESIDIAIYQGEPYDVYVTTKGRIIESDGSEAIPYENKDGFMTVNAKSLDGCKNCPLPIHMVVAETFVPNPLGLEHVGFKDLDDHNCAEDNLIWLSAKERLGMTSKNSDKALTLKRAHTACRMISEGKSNTDIAQTTGLSKGMVKSIRDKRIISWISDKYFDKDNSYRISKSGKRMEGNVRFTDDDIMEMYRLHQQGIRSSEIAAKFGTSKEYVNKVIKGDLRPDIKERFDREKDLVILCGAPKYARRNKQW